MINVDTGGTLEPSLSISVVVALSKHVRGLAECLDAIAAELQPKDELIVVSSDRIPDELLSQLDQIQCIVTDTRQLIPELWGRGMSVATAEIVAITTAHFLPSPNWLAEIRNAHRKFETPAIGGSIEPRHHGSMADWGTYFLRYSQYLRYTKEQIVDELAGDNASYKRGQLSKDDLKDGFWELEFHRRLVRLGKPLIFVPQIKVTQSHGFGFVGFLRQRLQHGVQFGQTRSQQWGLATRGLAVLASPIIPFLLFGKILVRVWRGGRYGGAFLFALPALISFILAWVLGEALGYALRVSDNRH